MSGYRIISSDNHVFEPADLWTTRTEPKFRDRAPRVVREADGDWGYCVTTGGPAWAPAPRRACGLGSRISSGGPPPLTTSGLAATSPQRTSKIWRPMGWM